MRPPFPPALPALIGACLLALVLPACTPRADPEGTPRRIAREVEASLTTVAQNELVRGPELGTRIGVSQDAAGFPLGRLLTDRSQAAFERARLERLETLDVLIRTARPAPGSALARNLDTVIAAHEAAEAVFVAGHGAGNLSVFYPYVADHQRGAWLDVPELLVRHQPMDTPADVDAFLSRFSQLPGALDDERRRLEADARAGIIPPAPVLDRMLALTALKLQETPETSLVIQTFDNLLSGIAGLTPEARARYAQQARDLFTQQILPAYARFAEGIAQLKEGAPTEPGIWQIRNGDAWYLAVLAAYTGTKDTPAELHARGASDVTRFTGQLDTALAALGLTEGSVPERLAMLAQQPGQLYEDSDLGRAALVERLTQLAEKAMPVADTQAGRRPAGSLTIRVTPAGFAAHAAPSSYIPRKLDQRSPAWFEINTARMQDWPDYTLPTLVFHNAVPGQHLENSLAGETAPLPLARRIIRNTGYAEGWAAYAETLADESGLYTDDPLGRIGYLRAMLLISARLVADTGIHQQKWTRERAAGYLMSAAGLDAVQAAEEVDRISAAPSDAAASWIGRQRILDLRERAQRVLGPRFDPVAFHTAILSTGPRPLDMVEADVTRWYTDAAR
ncbi:DUF885 domain-containing protein [Hyphomonas sp.]|uniref:DUF885 domain-containing protein n=1 Tax=Hyphomonas sp. TaxID=87 RepID=UPI00391D3958